MNTTADFGSVSTATMRPEDLIPAFLDCLNDLDEDRCAAILAEYPEYNNEDFYDTDDAQWLLEGLFDALDEYAPPFSYFGAHEGDGADYGFWPAIDALEDAARYGEVLKIDAGDDWPDDIDDDIEYVAEITDHGNITLFDRDHNEIWSIV